MLTKHYLFRGTICLVMLFGLGGYAEANSVLTPKRLIVATTNFMYSSGVVGVGQPTPTYTLDIRGGLRYSGTFFRLGDTATPNIFSHKLFYAGGSGSSDPEEMSMDVQQSRYVNSTSTGAHLVIMDTDGDLVSSTRYDIQSGSSAQTSFTSAINAITKSQIGLVVSYGNINASGQSDIDTMSIEQGLYGFNRLYRTGLSSASYVGMFRGSSGGHNSLAQEALSNGASGTPPAEMAGWFIQDAFVTTGIPGPSLFDPSEGIHDLAQIQFQSNDAPSEYMKIGRGDIESGYSLSIEGPLQVYENDDHTSGAAFALRASKDATEESYFKQFDGSGPAHANAYMWWGIADNWDSSATDKDLVVMYKNFGRDAEPTYRFQGNGVANSKYSFAAGGADYAEWVDSEEDIPAGSLVGLNPETGLARRYQAGDPYLGPVSSDPGFVGNDDIDQEGVPDNKVLLALMGQVEIDSSVIKVVNRRVYTVDDVYVGILLADERVLIGK